MKYYVRQADSPQDWKCQPNKWLSSKEEVHEIVVGWFSVTLGSALSAALATWVVNGGYTSLYYTPGECGLVWAVLEDAALQLENLFECEMFLPQTDFRLSKSTIYSPSK